MTVRPHGTRARYNVEHCRCMPCRIANTRYETMRAARTRQGFRTRHVGGGYWIVQGVDGGEVKFKSKDPAEARRVRDEMNQEWRRNSINEPYWAHGDTIQSVRKYLATLKANGIGLHRVAELTGISRTRLMEIKRGRGFSRNRPAKRRLKSTTAEKILGVPVNAAAAGAYVPAAETWRVINELRAIGLTKVAIAEAIGQVRALQLGRARVTARNARAVQALHDRIYRERPALLAVCRCPRMGFERRGDRRKAA